MIITDPKKLSMPQQVQKNKEDIEDIRKIIDGLDVEDNVVVVNNISQILTAEELEAIKQPVAFIVYNNHLYFKRSETSTTAYFDVVFAININTVITFESSEIQVELSNGALGIVNSTVSTYSETQIDNKLSLKANITYVDNNFASLSGANFTGAITAPSIIENMSGYSFNAVEQLAHNTKTILYVGAVKNGNKLTVVVFERVNLIDNTQITLGEVIIPQEVADKIIPTDVGDGNNLLDSRQLIVIGNSVTDQSSQLGFCVKAYGHYLRFFCSAAGLTLNKNYHIRYELTFLLSDSLAQ